MQIQAATEVVKASFPCYNRAMSSASEDKILGLPRRPRIGDASGGATLGAIAGGLLAGNWGGAVLGGLAGNALASQRQALEFAIRQRFAQNGWEVVSFYRAPRAVKVTFRSGNNAYWTVESVMPDTLTLTSEDTEDWLYGNLIENELPRKLHQVNAFLSR